MVSVRVKDIFVVSSILSPSGENGDGTGVMFSKDGRVLSAMAHVVSPTSTMPFSSKLTA